ncbi:MAG: hypothetical protein J6N53_07795 [Lachnospiraceae bacterium]|nr:hypothetical protein [Lachnospiraceae bacterium]MBR6849989.1 hypothetical protein [Lachnospiraceae bacterium]
MKDGKITVEFDLKKIAIAAGVMLSVWISCKTGEGDALLFIIPAGLYGLFSKEV